MLILAFDTTAAACSAALWRDGVVLAAVREVMDQGQAETLMPLIEGVMAEGKVSYADLSRIAVTVGPGSFTGVRVGLAAARGLGLAADKPVIGVLTTEALAAAVPENEAKSKHILAAMDTKRGDLYVQQFVSSDHPHGEPTVLAREALADWVKPGAVIVAGDAAAIAVAAIGPRARLSTADPLPDPAVIARLAAKREPSADGPLPAYVRPPEVTVPAHGGRLRP